METVSRHDEVQRELARPRSTSGSTVVLESKEEEEEAQWRKQGPNSRGEKKKGEVRKRKLKRLAAKRKGGGGREEPDGKLSLFYSHLLRNPVTLDDLEDPTNFTLFRPRGECGSASHTCIWCCAPDGWGGCRKPWTGQTKTAVWILSVAAVVVALTWALELVITGKRLLFKPRRRIVDDGIVKLDGEPLDVEYVGEAWEVLGVPLWIGEVAVMCVILVCLIHHGETSRHSAALRQMEGRDPSWLDHEDIAIEEKDGEWRGDLLDRETVEVVVAETLQRLVGHHYRQEVRWEDLSRVPEGVVIDLRWRDVTVRRILFFVEALAAIIWTGCSALLPFRGIFPLPHVTLAAIHTASLWLVGRGGTPYSRRGAVHPLYAAVILGAAFVLVHGMNSAFNPVVIQSRQLKDLLADRGGPHRSLRQRRVSVGERLHAAGVRLFLRSDCMLSRLQAAVLGSQGMTFMHGSIETTPSLNITSALRDERIFMCGTDFSTLPFARMWCQKDYEGEFHAAVFPSGAPILSVGAGQVRRGVFRLADLELLADDLENERKRKAFESSEISG